MNSKDVSIKVKDDTFIVSTKFKVRDEKFVVELDFPSEEFDLLIKKMVKKKLKFESDSKG